MIRTQIFIVFAWLTLLTAVGAQPSAPTGAAQRLTAAALAANDDDWPTVERLAAPVAHDSSASPTDRGEANRLLGLAAYHQHDLAAAEAGFLAYLQSDLDGRLDPSLYAPELVAFFENVRATHAAELRALRPRLRSRRSVVLNLIPPAGQFQNRQPTKGWILGGLGVGLLAAHLSTYIVLVRWCSAGDLTCEPEGRSRSEAARTLVTINQWSGAALIGAYAYGVIDGLLNYRRISSSSVTAGVAVSPSPFPGGAGITVMGAF